MSSRLFVDIFIRGTKGKYDFNFDNADARDRQLAKSGAKETEYEAFYATFNEIKNGKTSNNLLFALKRWHGKKVKTKLKIRINAHGAENTDGFWMGNAHISSVQLANWLSNNGLTHRATDSWSLTISLAVCFAAQVTAPTLIKALNSHNIKGFKLTASQYITYLPNGKVGYVTEEPWYFLGIIPWGTQEVDNGHWSIADGSKTEFNG